MPYSMIKVTGGYQIVSPNHPEGHSSKPMTHDNAIAQMMILKDAEEKPSKFEKYKAQRGAGPG
jgi:hypothetical protein